METILQSQQLNSMAYVYKWTHIPTLKWYIGSRTAEGCHPDDGYICSSKVVKPLIMSSPADWHRDIIDIGNPKDMLRLEVELLELADARSDPRSFNMTNGDEKFSTSGKKRPPISDETRSKLGRPGRKDDPSVILKRSNSRKGKKWTQEMRDKMSLQRKGKPLKPHSEETKLKMSAWQKGMPKPKKECPYCGALASPVNAKRWHFDNCKTSLQSGTMT